MQIDKKIKATWICIVGCFAISCSSPPTEEEFKEKYDWGESVAVYVDDISRQSGYDRVFQFEYEGKRHRVEIYANSVVPMYFGYKYLVLFDKSNPDKNYKVLEDSPVIDNPVAFTAVGKIRRVIKDYDVARVWYDYNVEYPDHKEQYESCEDLPIEYLEICKKIKERKDEIIINLHLFEESYVPFIDRESVISYFPR